MPHRIFDLTEISTIQCIKRLIKTEPVAFLIGSAVSSFTPSSLPSGQSISSQVSKYLLRDEQPERGSERYRRLMEFTRSSAFEHLLEHYPKQVDLKNYISNSFRNSRHNRIHLAIAKVCADTGSPVITTNYDTLLEDAFRDIGQKFRRIVTKKQILSEMTRCAKSSVTEYIPIFKIHGCAKNPQSIVLRMSEEGMLSEERYDYLCSLLHKRKLIVIGYSGQDFEICPALQAANVDEIYWNALSYHPSQLGMSENFKSLSKSIKNPSRFSILSGDMRCLFGVDESEAKFELLEAGIESFFDRNLNATEAAIWRASFFSSIAAPHAVKRQFEKLPSKEGRQARANFHYRRGEYLSSHRAKYPARDNASETRNQKIKRLLDCSFVYRNAGLQRIAKARCINARKLWEGMSEVDKKINEGEILWSTVLNFPADEGGPWEQAAVQLEDLWHKAGNWSGIYNLRIHLLQRGREELAAPGRLYAFMNARDGYSHIGNISAYVDEFTRGCRDGNYQYHEFSERIFVAELFQLNPNVYKCCYAALRSPNIKGPLLRFALFLKCIHFMMKCEYSNWLRFYIIILASISLMCPNCSKEIS